MPADPVLETPFYVRPQPPPLAFAAPETEARRVRAQPTRVCCPCPVPDASVCDRMPMSRIGNQRQGPDPRVKHRKPVPEVRYERPPRPIPTATHSHCDPFPLRPVPTATRSHRSQRPGPALGRIICLARQEVSCLPTHNHHFSAPISECRLLGTNGQRQISDSDAAISETHHPRIADVAAGPPKKESLLRSTTASLSK